MEREVHYCTTEDGVRIAYCVQGDGLPLVMCPFFLESFSLHDIAPGMNEFLGELGRERRLVLFDYRGTGLSDRAALGGFKDDRDVRDLAAVVNACGLDTFALFGPGAGGPTAMRYAALNPGRVSHLILFSTFALGAATMTPDARYGMAALAESNWPMAAQTFADITLRKDHPEQALRWSEVIQRSVTGEAVARLLREMPRDFDVSGCLGDISCPTLVLHRQGGGMAPLEEGQRIAAAIPNARLVPLDGTGAHFTLGDTGRTLRAVDQFLQDRVASTGATTAPSPERSQGGMAVILFTDIVDSTVLTERMGDAAFRSAARALDGRLRAAIRDAGGTPVDGQVLGDGVMAIFTSAADGIDAARRCVELSAESELRLHVGLHAGDVIREDSNVYGGAVNIAARVCAASAAGEILVSATIRELARTSAGVTFDDRGEHALKGIDDAVRLYGVRWQ